MAANRRYYIDGSTVRKIEDMPEKQVRRTSDAVSYTHLTLPTIYSV